MNDRPRQRGLRSRLSRAARLGAVSLQASAGWLAGVAIWGLGGLGPADRLRRAVAVGMAEGLGQLKGLAMKLGQVLSFALDDVPVELHEALEALQTSSPPRPFTEIAPVIERALRRPLRDAFATIDPVPISDVLGKDLAEVRRHLRVPKDLVFVNRTLAGLYMVLSRLGAAASWGRIARKYTNGEPPSTSFGVAERAWCGRKSPVECPLDES